MLVSLINSPWESPGNPLFQDSEWCIEGYFRKLTQKMDFEILVSSYFCYQKCSQHNQKNWREEERTQNSSPYVRLSFLRTAILFCLIEVIATPRSSATYVRRRRRKAQCYIFDGHKLLLFHSNSSMQEAKLWLCKVPHPHPKLITHFCTKNK